MNQKPKNKHCILFVCHGNICRSPMAEYVMKHLVAEAGKDYKYYIESAGTSDEEEDNPVYPPAQSKLAEHGIKCQDKRARQIVPEDYANFDLIICMDDWNVRNCPRFFGGDPDNKIELLMAFAGQRRIVSDPWYTDDFQTTWNDVLTGCQALFKYIEDIDAAAK